MLVAFDIGGSRIRAACAPAPGRLTPCGEAPMPVTFPDFAAAVAGLLPKAASAVAISIAGVVDPADGRLVAANLPAVNGRAVGADLRQALGLPVWIGNDADCFTLAEALEGVGRGHRNVFGVILGSGVGGGLVIDGRLVAGAGGFAGEWGHGPVLDQRPLGRPVPHFACGCGQRGCIDTVGGARGIERLHRHLSGRTATSLQILAGWHEGEPAARETVEVWLDLLAGPLAMVLNVVGASVVPVGGGLANDHALVAALDLAVRRRVLRPAPAALLLPAAQAKPGLAKPGLAEPGLAGAALAGWQAFG